MKKIEITNVSGLEELAKLLNMAEKAEQTKAPNGQPGRPSFLALVHPDTGVSILGNSETGEAELAVPAVVLVMLDKDKKICQDDSADEDNTIVILLQPSTALGLYMRLAEYIKMIGMVDVIKDGGYSAEEIYAMVKTKAEEFAKSLGDGLFDPFESDEDEETEDYE